MTRPYPPTQVAYVRLGAISALKTLEFADAELEPHAVAIQRLALRDEDADVRQARAPHAQA